MKPVRMIILGAVFGIVSQAAFAFQETNSGAATTAPAAGAKLGVPDASAPAKGPEIRVPGLGTIGALPKLDFGLELLYGATGTPAAGPREDKSESGAQIRGTLKYRFPN